MTQLRTKFNPERFNQDYLRGLVGESIFKDWCKMGDMNIIHQAPNNRPFSDYDFKVQYSGERERKLFPLETLELPPIETHEIKTEFTDSKNVAIHFHSTSKQETSFYIPNCSLSCNAGLYKTKADFYTIYNVNDRIFYIAPVANLREYISKTPRLKKVIANKHKSEQTGLVLIPKKEWKENFYLIHYSPDTYTEI